MEDNPLLTPDFLTPSQWRDAHQRAEADPIRRLAFALLDDALRDLLGSRKRSRWTAKHAGTMNRLRGQRASEAAAWVFDEAADNEDLLFSFGNVCDTLGIGADGLRRRLRERLGENAREAA